MPKDPMTGPLRPPAPETGPVMLPLDFMLALLRDESASLADRKWAAERAAPYCHPRASAAAQEDPGIRQEDALDALA
ncbi:MAG: hypothetical protein MI785_21355 [Kiloniellales bacterium]|nr:hypothetical protein [Kiloniellales bacterium]